MSVNTQSSWVVEYVSIFKWPWKHPVRIIQQKSYIRRKKHSVGGENNKNKESSIILSIRVLAITFRVQDDLFSAFLLQICTKRDSKTLSSKCNLLSQEVVAPDKSAFEFASVDLNRSFKCKRSMRIFSKCWLADKYCAGKETTKTEL